MSSEEFNEDTLPDLLPLYYKRLFPHLSFYRWLSGGDPVRFSTREISFTLLGDIYIRFLSFDSHEEFVQKIYKDCPIKIDIGAMYKTKPKHRSPVEPLTPLEKEIVFDIDMTDYDDVRVCCSGADVCTKCWKFMVIACKILDAALREDFGFNNLLWVFSGRRGIHCWVSDPSVMKYDDRERSGIAEYLQLVKGGAHQAKKVILPGDKIHSSLKRALKIVEKYFLTIVDEQDLLGSEDKIDAFLKLVDENLRSTFKDDMQRGNNSKEKWEIFANTYSVLSQKGQIPKNSRHLIEEIKLQYTYPRLDINVSKGLNHLLKAPFCVHPKSGKIAIPFNPKIVDNFNPATVPTINLLINEINMYDAKTKENEKSLLENEETPASIAKIKDYKKTSLIKPVSLFEEFLRGLEKSRRALKLPESMEF